MTVERLSCLVHTRSSSRSSSKRWWKWINEDDDGAKEEYVRVFVNDAKQPLHFCGASGDGMCRLEEFVSSQGYARNGGFGDFAACAYTGR